MRIASLLLALLALLGAGCTSQGVVANPIPDPPVIPPPDDDPDPPDDDPDPPDDDPDPPDPPVLTASVRLVSGDEAIEVGETRTFGEEFSFGGVERVEWDFDYDGTTFTVDRSDVAPTTPGAPVQVYFGAVGARTIALRGQFPDALTSPVATMTLTVSPRAEPARFRNAQLDVSETGFNETGPSTPYGGLLAPGKPLAVSGNTLLAMYYASIEGVWTYYLVASNDGGGTWGLPTPLSTDALDRPFLSRQPQLTATPLNGEWLVAWVNAEGLICYAPGTIDGSERPVFTRGAPALAPTTPGEARGYSPLLLTDPADPSRARLIRAAGNVAGESSLVLTEFAPAVALREVYEAEWTIGELDALWATDPMLILVEELGSSLDGGYGGSSTTHRVLHIDTIADDGTRVLTGIADLDTDVPLDSALAANATTVLVAANFEESFVRQWGTYSAAGVSFGVHTVVTPHPDIALSNTAALWTEDGWYVVYSLEGDPDPAIASGHSEQLWVQSWLPDLSAQRFPEYLLNTDDPEENEGHWTPALAAGPEGSACAVWVGARFNRAAPGRFSFNRTR